MTLDTRTATASASDTRRSFLAAAIAALAGGVLAAFGRPAPVRAASQDMYTETTYNVTAATALSNSTNANTVFAAHNNKWGIGLRGSSDEGDGVRGIADRGIGVRGRSEKVVGVLGTSTSGEGVQGSSIKSIGVRGETISLRQPGVWGRSSGLSGVIGSASNSDYPPIDVPAGVYGYATKKYRHRGAPVGVYGDGSTGRGGTFRGDAAPLQLVPSTDPSHPTNGRRGDLFVDNSGRLWFCKGAASWVQLA